MNYARRHSYYVKKTMAWLESKGYVTEKVEYSSTHGPPGRLTYSKKDLWGSDIICRSAEAIAFIQVKSSVAQVSKGVRQLTADEAWPISVGRYVIWWDARAKEPNIKRISGPMGL